MSILQSTTPATRTPASATIANELRVRKCPYCAEEIQRTAIVCRYCGRDLNPRAVREVNITLARSWKRNGFLKIILFLFFLPGWSILVLDDPDSDLSLKVVSVIILVIFTLAVLSAISSFFLYNLLAPLLR